VSSFKIVIPTMFKPPMTDDLDPLFMELCEAGYTQKLEELIAANSGDIDPTFLGFTEIYKNLAEIIPKGRMVIDLGCGHAPQQWYFRNHRRYYGVDLTPGFLDLGLPNVRLKTQSIEDWIREVLPTVRRGSFGSEFAILNYVPDWHGDVGKLTRETFEHLFVFYPKHGDRPQ
jgi:hypothetical protein